VGAGGLVTGRVQLKEPCVLPVESSLQYITTTKD
jgi:hypothetical protein